MRMKPLKKHVVLQTRTKKLGSWLFGRVFLPGLPFAGLIIIWHLAARNLQADLLPSPVIVGKAILELARTGVLLPHILTSLFRVFCGFFLAVCCAVPIGIV